MLDFDSFESLNYNNVKTVEYIKKKQKQRLKDQVETILMTPTNQPTVKFAKPSKKQDIKINVSSSQTEFFNAKSRNKGNFATLKTSEKKTSARGKLVNLEEILTNRTKPIKSSENEDQREDLNTNFTLRTSQTNIDKNMFYNNTPFKKTGYQGSRLSVPDARELFKTNVFNQNSKKNLIFKKGISEHLPNILKTINKNNNNHHTVKKDVNKYHTKLADVDIPLEGNQINPELKRIITNFEKASGTIKMSQEDNIKYLGSEFDLRFYNSTFVVNPIYFDTQFRFIQRYFHPENDELLNRIFAQLIDKKFKIRKELLNYVQSENTKLVDIKNMIFKWKKVMIPCAIHFSRLKLTLEEFYNYGFKNQVAWKNDGSKLFIHAVKENKDKLIISLFEKNKFYVHDFDHFFQTPLHWAVKRNNFNLIPLLSSMGGRIDAEDFLGRTPLHIACINNFVESTKYLLLEVADPFKKYDGKKTEELTSNDKIRSYLRRAKMLHAIHKLMNTKLFEERVRRGLEFCFNSDLKSKGNS